MAKKQELVESKKSFCPICQHLIPENSTVCPECNKATEINVQSIQEVLEEHKRRIFIRKGNKCHLCKHDDVFKEVLSMKLDLEQHKTIIQRIQQKYPKIRIDDSSLSLHFKYHCIILRDVDTSPNQMVLSGKNSKIVDIFPLADQDINGLLVHTQNDFDLYTTIQTLMGLKMRRLHEILEHKDRLEIDEFEMEHIAADNDGDDSGARAMSMGVSKDWFILSKMSSELENDIEKFSVDLDTKLKERGRSIDMLRIQNLLIKLSEIIDSVKSFFKEDEKAFDDFKEKIARLFDDLNRY